jgi:undecaprenyl diphosphate synthase
MAFAEPVVKKYYTSQETARVDFNRIPQHIAIIMDGNRRWAEQHASSILDGHTRGADILIDILKAGKELGVQVMTLYVFSTENWNRPQEEVLALMWLYETYIRKQIPEMLEEGMRFDTIGDSAGLPIAVQEAISEAKQATRACACMKVVFAMNYGARDEICRAFQKMAKDMETDTLKREAITEKAIASYLDTALYPDPDLLIRTSGEQRISNFLLWQLSYAEVYMTPTLWPAFTPAHLLEAVVEFQSRERRQGR